MNVDYQIMTLRKIYKHWNGALELIASLQKENEELKEKEKNLLLQLKDSEKELLEISQKLQKIQCKNIELK